MGNFEFWGELQREAARTKFGFNDLLRENVGSITGRYTEDQKNFLISTFRNNIQGKVEKIDLKREIITLFQFAKNTNNYKDFSLLPNVFITLNLLLGKQMDINKQGIEYIIQNPNLAVNGAILIDLSSGYNGFTGFFGSSLKNIDSDPHKQYPYLEIIESLNADDTGISAANLVLERIKQPEGNSYIIDTSLFKEGANCARDIYTYIYPQVADSVYQLVEENKKFNL